MILSAFSSIVEHLSKFSCHSSYNSVNVRYKKDELWFKEPPGEDHLQNVWYIHARYVFSSSYSGEDEYYRLKITINNADNSIRNHHLNLKFYFEDFSKSIRICVMSSYMSDNNIIYDCKIFKGQIENICFQKDLATRIFDDRDISADYLELDKSETNRIQDYLKQLYVKANERKKKLTKFVNR